MSRQSGKKRRHGRLTLSEPLVDQVTASHDVAILDLSMGGARVEHSMMLRPGGTCRVMRFHKSDQLAYSILAEFSIAIEQQEVATATKLNGLVVGPRKAEVGFIRHEPHPHELIAQHGQAVIMGSVIDDNRFSR